jgi:hypothetical protein
MGDKACAKPERWHRYSKVMAVHDMLGSLFDSGSQLIYPARAVKKVRLFQLLSQLTLRLPPPSP